MIGFKRIFIFTFASSIFSSSFVFFPDSISISLYIFFYIFVLIGSIFLLKKIYFPKYIIGVFLFFLAHGFISVYLFNLSTHAFFRVYLSIVLAYVALSQILKTKFDIYRILKIYLILCAAVSSVGILQVLSYLIGFRLGYDYSWISNVWVLAESGPLGIRANSFLFEPSQVAVVLGLAIPMAISRFFGMSKEFIGVNSSILIIFFSILSFSVNAYVVTFISIIGILIFSGKKIIVFISAMLMPVVTIILTVDLSFLTERLSGVTELYLNSASENSDASSFSLYANTIVAFDQFVSTNGWGGGLGSHAGHFERFAEKMEWETTVYQIGTAGNLFNRLVSELGGFGILLMLLWAFIGLRLLLRRWDGSEVLIFCFWMACFGFLSRSGTYAHFGLAFYIVSLIHLWRR